MPRIGNTTISPEGLIESRSISVAELAHVLDVLLIANKLKQESWHFPDLVALLDQVTKVNPHQHITGSIGDPKLLMRVIQVYRQDQVAQAAFLDYILNDFLVREEDIPGFFEQSDDALLEWFQRKIPLSGDPADFDEADDRLNLIRLAFQSSHPDSLELLQEAYRIVALENAQHGVEEVWFRTALGDHETDGFKKAAEAALRGAHAAVAGSPAPLQVKYLIGLRKQDLETTAGNGKSDLIDRRAEGLVSAIQQLRSSRPNAKRMLWGIDSVGLDSRWRPEWQATARRAAAKARLRVAVHFGESWQEGELLIRLKILQDLVEFGTIQQLDNANILFAVKDLANSDRLYSNDHWAEIRQVQRKILDAMVKREIALGINPTSNDWLTRSLRRREGWRFRELEEPLGVGMASVVDLMIGGRVDSKHLIVVVGNDNSRLYGSRVPGGFLTVSEELANLWDAHGSIECSIYGKVSTEVVARLISNGFVVARSSGDDLLDEWHSPVDLLPESVLKLEDDEECTLSELESMHSSDINVDRAQYPVWPPDPPP